MGQPSENEETSICFSPHISKKHLFLVGRMKLKRLSSTGVAMKTSSSSAKSLFDVACWRTELCRFTALSAISFPDSNN